MLSDLEIAHAAKPRPMRDVAGALGVSEDVYEPYGHDKAKLPLSLIKPAAERKDKKLILVTAITPTPSGEGKTTTSIGLADGLAALGRKTCVALREPSLGPVFGMKGGAAGGGYSQVIPMEDINLHFCGDFAAIEKANNLLAALIDNNVQSKTRSLDIDPRTVVWKRCIDMNDRGLRTVVAGLGGTAGGVPYESGFNITAASEIMAILCMATSLSDLKQRLGNIYIGNTRQGSAVFARDLNAQGAMAMLLKDAVKPNLVQTLEGTPAVIHGGPFANIAQGTNSILATTTAMSLADYTVTEAGFGADIGAEKFLNIKCREAGVWPNCVVVVATVRALKYHGGASLQTLTTPDVTALEMGTSNLAKHIENMQTFGLPVVVSINRFASDSDEELAFLKEWCLNVWGVRCEVAEGFTKGSEGTKALAEAVVAACDEGTSKPKFLYSLDDDVMVKITTICKTIYGAADVTFEPKALGRLRRLRAVLPHVDRMPLCMVKTQKSLSDSEKLLGRPKGFVVCIREFEVANGAGFLIPICGSILRMPGLPATPAAEGMDIDDAGVISGLS